LLPHLPCCFCYHTNTHTIDERKLKTKNRTKKFTLWLVVSTPPQLLVNKHTHTHLMKESEK